MSSCFCSPQDAMFWEVPKVWLSSAQDFNPEPNADDEIHEKTPLGINICANFHDLPVLFFLQCMNLLNEGGRQKKAVPDHGSGFGQKGVKRSLCGLIPRASNQSLLFAFKCSLSLGLAVLLGLTYTKQNGYWSGLTIAISFVRNRQATFSTTNARAQGTALGTAYGVLGYFFCRKFELLKLVSLLPWIIFTTFLRHSKMYGEAGSISAAVAALLILGRRDYGTPTDFAIARLIESFIGLFCFILVEILVKPERAETLVKARVSDSFRSLKLLLEEIVAQMDGAKSSSSSCLVEEKKRAMKIQVDELNRLVEEAREEPDFWFKAFQDECYTSLLESAKRIADALFFMAYSVEELTLELKKPETEWKRYRDQINVHIELFKRVASASFLRVAEEMGSNQYNAGDRKQQLKPGLIDTETGVPASHIRRFSITDINEEEARIILDSFLHHAQGLIECRKEMEDPELKKRILLRFGSLAFCMQILVADTTEVGRLINELNLRKNLWDV